RFRRRAAVRAAREPGSRAPAREPRLAEGREVDDRAADGGGGDLERALAGGDRRQDVGVAGQLGRGDAGGPVEGLQVPRAAGVPDLGGDEVEHVAGAGVAGEGGLGAGQLYRGHGPGGVDDVVHDVPVREHLGLVRRGGDLRGGLVFDRLVVVVAEVGGGRRGERGGGGRERGGGGRGQPGEGAARGQQHRLHRRSAFVVDDAAAWAGGGLRPAEPPRTWLPARSWPVTRDGRPARRPSGQGCPRTAAAAINSAERRVRRGLSWR